MIPKLIAEFLESHWNIFVSDGIAGDYLRVFERQKTSDLSLRVIFQTANKM